MHSLKKCLDAGCENGLWERISGQGNNGSFNLLTDFFNPDDGEIFSIFILFNGCHLLFSIDILVSCMTSNLFNSVWKVCVHFDSLCLNTSLICQPSV